MRKSAKTTPTDVTPNQARVVVSLIGGATVTKAAQEAGISRRTVNNWNRTDAKFIAAHNQARIELFEAARARLLTLVEAAFGVVGQAIEAGDVRTALVILRGAGLLSGQVEPAGPTDEEEAELEITERQSDLASRNMFAALNF